MKELPKGYIALPEESKDHQWIVGAYIKSNDGDQFLQYGPDGHKGAWAVPKRDVYIKDVSVKPEPCGEDLLIWPDGTECNRSELAEFTHKSDDYMVIPFEDRYDFPEPTGIEALVCVDIATRQRETGIKKYKSTVARSPETEDAWIRHFYKELLDATIYLRKIIKDRTGN